MAARWAGVVPQQPPRHLGLDDPTVAEASTQPARISGIERQESPGQRWLRSETRRPRGGARGVSRRPALRGVLALAFLALALAYVAVGALWMAKNVGKVPVLQRPGSSQQGVAQPNRRRGQRDFEARRGEREVDRWRRRER